MFFNKILFLLSVLLTVYGALNTKKSINTKKSKVSKVPENKINVTKKQRIPASRYSKNKLPHIDIGETDFKKFLLENNLYIDKSLFIKDFIEDEHPVIMITRPHLWGKTLNLRMLQTFFNIETNRTGHAKPYNSKKNIKFFLGGKFLIPPVRKVRILKPLLISQHETIILNHQGQYPVIFFSLASVDGDTFEEIMNTLVAEIKKVYHNFFYLSQHYRGEFFEEVRIIELKQFRRYCHEVLDYNEIEDSMRFLSRMLFNHFRQGVIIIFDGYDGPIMRAYMKFGVLKDDYFSFRNILLNLYSKALGDNTAITKGVLSGIFRIPLAEWTRYEHDSTKVYSLKEERYFPYFGFLESEVENLTKIMPELVPNQLLDFYGGYQFREVDEYMYNPFSVMMCIKNNSQLAYYWRDQNVHFFMEKLLKYRTNVRDYTALATGGVIRKTYIKTYVDFCDGEFIDDDAAPTILFYGGYLSVIATQEYECQLFVPNNEILNIFTTEWIPKLPSVATIELNTIEEATEQPDEYIIERFESHIKWNNSASSDYNILDVYGVNGTFHRQEQCKSS